MDRGGTEVKTIAQQSCEFVHTVPCIGRPCCIRCIACSCACVSEMRHERSPVAGNAMCCCVVTARAHHARLVHDDGHHVTLKQIETSLQSGF